MVPPYLGSDPLSVEPVLFVVLPVHALAARVSAPIAVIRRSRFRCMDVLL